IIDTSDTQKLTWTPYSDDPKIYEALCTLTLSGHPASPDAIIMDDDFRKCRPVYSIAEVNAFGKWYFDKTSRKIYVYTNGTSPLLHDIIVTKHDPDNIEFGIYAVGINYLTIYGVTVRGAGAYEIYATGKKVRIEKCTLKFSGKGGIVADGDYNEFIKNHVWGNVLLNWPRGRTWNTSGGWPMGMVAKGSYSLMRGNISHDNGGEGIGTGSFPGFNIIEDNISYDNWSVNIYAGHQSDGTIRRNLVYCTGGEKNYALDADRLPLWSSLGKVYKRMRPEAIMIADEDYQSKVVSERNQIYNNIMIGCAKGFTYYGQAIGAGIKDVYIANNTIVLPDADNPEGVWVGIDIPYNKGNNRNTVIVNNIVYGVHSDQPLIWLKGGTNEKGIRLDNNLYFSRNYKTPFWSGDLITTKDDFPSWKNRYTQDMNNLYNDPIFKNTPAELTKGDYHLQPDSPAIGKGTNSVSSIVKEDFDLLSRSKNIPTIGAYESRN
ncbi:MAG TPA: hypothetical protein DEG92_07620, partial [Rikenellaceae bacterium]|nr:hypothetical protein [Rikenellaceae bacterium]